MERLGPPPPGGDQTRGPMFLALSLTTTILVVVSLCLRMIGRVGVLRQFGWDDVCIILASILSIVTAVFNFKQINAGGGRHTYYLTLSQIFGSLEWVLLSEFLVIWITCLTKVSICLFVMRIPNDRRLKSFLWALIGLLVVVNGACVVVFLAQCRPLKALWDPTAEGSCWKPEVFEAFAYVQGAFSVFTDLICTALPIVVLWRVKISTKTKVAICILMGLGLFASACSLARCLLLKQVSDPVDNSWNVITAEIWTMFENNIGIIAANMPAMLPLWRALREQIPKRISSFRSFLGYSPADNENAHCSMKRSKFSRMDGRMEPSKTGQILKIENIEIHVDDNSSTMIEGSHITGREEV